MIAVGLIAVELIAAVELSHPDDSLYGLLLVLGTFVLTGICAAVALQRFGEFLAGDKRWTIRQLVFVTAVAAVLLWLWRCVLQLHR